MARGQGQDLRTGFTTGACATAAARAAYLHLTTGAWRSPVQITLPKGETPSFELVETAKENVEFKVPRVLREPA